MHPLNRLKIFVPLIREMVRREIRGRYIGSALGFFWSVIHPLLQLAVFTLVFGGLLNVRLSGTNSSVGGFALYLFCGLLPWNSFSEVLSRGSGSLLENANLIKNLHFPAKAIQIALVINAMLHQCLGLAILLVIATWIHRGFFFSSLLMLPLLGLQLIFMLGVALLAAPIAVTYRDSLQLVPVVSMVWMYITPLFYSETLVTDHHARYSLMFTLNPMRYFVQMSRALLLDGTVPGIIDWAIVSQMSLLALLLGYIYYTRRHPGFADEL